MLKRIVPSEVRLGMFIQGFEGSWLAHPFWRTHFHLTDPDDLQRVRASRVRLVVIDEAKGVRAAVRAPIPAMPVCVVHDRVPDVVAGVRPRARRRDGVIVGDVRAILTRHILTVPDATPTAQGERDEVVRVLTDASRALTRTFDAVARGDAFSIDGFERVVEGISVAMANSRSTVIGLSRLKLKDEYTFQHSVAVGALMLGLARDLDLDEDVTRDLALGGLLHDVGKMRIANAILSKPGPLTDAEFAEMKRHPELGHAILKSDRDISPIVLEVTLRHHERLDGRGYPDGLVGDAVSPYARMAGICDVFDALTSARVYKDAMPAHDAITMMASWEGQFDRAMLVTFMHTIGAYPAGMLVRLSSQRLGVILPPGRRAARPRARVFHCATQDQPLPPCDVVISDHGRGEQVLSEERPDDWSIDDWPALSAHLIGGATRRGA